MVNRRQFLQTLISGIAATAMVKEFPFKVYSIPSKIKLFDANAIRKLESMEIKFLKNVRGALVKSQSFDETKYWKEFGFREHRMGKIIFNADLDAKLMPGKQKRLIIPSDAEIRAFENQWIKI
jgi:hypothetical protein